ncbi:MAG: hypothetical protein Q8867_06310 [Bacteroidota bacterium]|nr:hypothetical protein [Bacteroidota bacterium]
MVETGSLVSEIERKLGQLIRMYNDLKEKQSQTESENERLKQLFDTNKQEIRDLKENIKNLTLTKTIENKEGAAEAKAKINELLREIDKCIGLLNS